MRRLRLAAPVSFLGVLLSSCGLFKSAPPPAEGFTTAKDVELTLWAAEPDLVNPTNIAIDERGRVWVTEALNYRRHLKELPDVTDQGDRIVILEDTNGDGKADLRKVFDQSMDLRAPLGIGVFGNKVYVSQSPDLWVYTKDENDNIVSKEKLLSGWGGYDHDHGLHAVTFGHDGRLWFNSGDQGFDVTDKSGRRFVSSREGPYYAGAALRMNEDGTDFTVFAHNFRNPYELVMDSFGTIWQTDNDDDGNKWTRLNYVMEGGNFGYWGPGGKRWREDHGTHFHHELPGVAPDIARTGAGSPTGIVIYEGTLLPERYRGNLIHSEPGKRHIYSFFLRPEGAGYDMDDEETVSADDPNWRPSDVAVSPDGVVFIADWYDPVVGGHNMKDIEKGRIYRLAPPKYLPKGKPDLDLDSSDGLRAAFRSPNPATHYRAWQELKLRGEDALPLLEEMWKGDDPVLQARSLWLLGLIGGKGRPEIDSALGHADAKFRILGLRVGRLVGRDIVALVKPLLADSDPTVRRECALALQYVGGEAAAEPLTTLAMGYDGKDRWYLEAWAIGARGKEAALATALMAKMGGAGFDPKLADFLWELHAPGALPYLTRAVHDENLSENDRLRALRAIGDRTETQAAKTVAGLVSSSSPRIAEAAFDKLSRQLFSQWVELRKDPLLVSAIRRALAEPRLQAAALQLSDDLGDPAYGSNLMAIAQNEQAPEENRARAMIALGQTREARYLPALQSIADSGKSLPLRIAAMRGISNARPNDLDERMEKLLFDDNPNDVRSEALRILGRNDEGLSRILDFAEKDELPAEVKSLATSMTHRSRAAAIVARAEAILPAPKDKANNTLPANPYEIVNRTGDVEKGKQVFYATDGPKCSSCHSLDDAKELAGPNLTTIGSKYDKRGLLDAILNPSAGIAPEYYVYILDTTTPESPVIGVLAEDTSQQVVVRNEFGDEIRLEPSQITGRRKSNLSMMPEDIVNTMTEQQLIDCSSISRP
jgi:putative membrane-bound dehydrogenase-like protein